jgi:hypothetical protein
VDFNFEKEELLLFGISILFAFSLHSLTQKIVASYVNNDDKCVYYKYKNGFGFESYSKREINGSSLFSIAGGC